MIELLALASAVLYGSADFFGGLTARRANTIATVVWSQFAGLVLLLLAIPFLPATIVSSRDWIWGFVAGLSGGIGVAFLYRALAVGTMAVVAPTTAVIAAMIPVLFAFFMGERLRSLTFAGVALALIAIFLVSRPPRLEQPDRKKTSGRFPPGFGLAVTSGVLVGIFFLSLARTTMAAGMWPLVAARISSIGLFAIIALVAKRTLRMDRTASATATLGGALDMAANAVFMTAARIGPLSIVVTLASLYPASTVILARIILKEHLSRTQIAGIACALLAVVLIVSQGAAG
ncbi:MAG TPA: DMT family transporter [Chthoniobacterales bacterium]|jgi:drug/metabolite transporter (DMT)-like permease|nr:DMT family transporter [Chthoniobacterales bacterium]